MIEKAEQQWAPGAAPVAIVMIALNESHNLQAVLENLKGWAQEVFLVDSYSSDDTVDIALANGVHVAQRRFYGFGDQWNFAVSKLPISSPWTMKIDPDERLTEKLKTNLVEAMESSKADAITISRRLWFMGRPLPVSQKLLRVWRTGTCRFSDVLVNEHPLVQGRLEHVGGELQHHDSPDLHHWVEKQNGYTTSEAISAYQGRSLSAQPRLLGDRLQRRMWLKRHFHRLPGRYLMLFVYHWLIQGAWRAGWPGYVWARLRADVMRLIDYKRREIELTGNLPPVRPSGPGRPDPRVPQYD